VALVEAARFLGGHLFVHSRTKLTHNQVPGPMNPDRPLQVPLPRRFCRGHCAAFREAVPGESPPSRLGGHVPPKPNCHEQGLAPLQHAHSARVTWPSGICLLGIALVNNYRTPIFDSQGVGKSPSRSDRDGLQQPAPLLSGEANKFKLPLIVFSCSRLVFS
jgi:hypothetical protein